MTIARGPGTFPIVGTLGPGASGRQRLNLERTRVRGLELTAAWQSHRQLRWTASYQFDDATVQRASLAPALVGKRVAQVPRHNGTFTASWKTPAYVTLAPRVRWIGRQYEDDENTLLLGEVVVADIGLTCPLTPSVECFVNVENVGNARIETGRSADGIVNVGTPRLWFAGIRAKW